VELARKYMQSLPVGGRTPLAHGLSLGLEVMKRELLTNHQTIPRLILISDGRANVGMGSASPMDDAKSVAAQIRDAHIPSLVIDSEKNFIALGLAQELSVDLGGRYIRLEDLESGQLAGLVKGFGM
jgi:magnesium chelatase subunit D